MLQIKLSNLVYRDLLSDTINSFILLFRREDMNRTWTEVGRTAIIYDEMNPEYPEAFPISFSKSTNLSEDMLKVVCYNHKEPLGHNDIIGTAKISMRELVRAFGTRVQIELVKKRNEKVVGSVWFLGESLPVASPRESCTQFRFKISSMAPRKSEVKHQTPKVFLVISREREDKTWSVVYRSSVVKRGSFVGIVNRKAPLTFKAFQISQADLTLSMATGRKIKFTFFQKGKNSEPHVCVGEVTTSVDELVNDFVADTSLDLCLNGEVVGEFADVARHFDDEKVISLQVEVNYFDSEGDARQIEERRKRKTLNLNSP